MFIADILSALLFISTLMVEHIPFQNVLSNTSIALDIDVFCRSDVSGSAVGFSIS